LERLGQDKRWGEVKAALLNDLNELLKKDGFYEPSRFAGVKLSRKTARVSNADRRGAHGFSEPRLIEDAFPRRRGERPRGHAGRSGGRVPQSADLILLGKYEEARPLLETQRPEPGDLQPADCWNW